MLKNTLSHLEKLESEAIHIIREVVAQADNPVMLYSIGKDSAVMLHLAKKAFYPGNPPFPLLHIDTTWKFQEMYALREKAAKEANMELIVFQNPEALKLGINPFDHGERHTELWKTEGLKLALDLYNFDAAFGGARRDEENHEQKSVSLASVQPNMCGNQRHNDPNYGRYTMQEKNRRKYTCLPLVKLD